MKFVKLLDVCEFQGGSQPPKDEWIETPRDGYVRMLQIRDFTQARESKEEYVLKNNRLKYCEVDDILIGRYGASVGKILTGLTGAYNVAIMKTIPKISVLSKRYLYYYLISPRFQTFIKNVGSRAAQAGFNKEDLDELVIPLPPLETQKKIAAVLDKAQELIDKRKEQLVKLDEFVQSVFLEMFGDPVSNVKKWSTYKGSDYSDMISVGVVVKPASYYTDQGVIALRSLNIKPNHIDLSNLVHFSKEACNGILSKSVLQQGDVVIVRTGLTGTAAVIPQELEGVNCIDLIIVRPKKTILNPHYLAYMLNSERGKNLVSSKEVGGIQKHFNIGAIRDINFPIPPLALQNQFAAIVEKTEQQKALMQQSLTEMENNFNSLMQRAFKGELF